MSYFTGGSLPISLGSYNGDYTGGYTSGYAGGTYARVTKTDISDLIRYIENGNAKQVMQKYNQMNIAGNSQVRNRIENYFARYYGVDLTTALEQSAGSSFTSGLKQGVPLFGLFDDGLSGDEVEAMITGIDESMSSKVAEYTGGIVGGGASAAAIGAAIGTWICPGPGSAIGAGIGFIVGAINGGITVAAKDQQNNKTALA